MASAAKPAFEWNERRLKTLQSLLNDGMIHREIAAVMGCSKHAIGNACFEHNIRKTVHFARKKRR